MNIKIVHANISEPFCQYEKYLPFITKERQDKINRFHFDKDKIISLFAEILMRNEISKELNIPFDEIVFGHGEHGKPYLLNNRDYHFSVSHSGNCIAFVGSEFSIGIDIEQISDGNLDIAKRFFTDNEFHFIQNNKEPKNAFYQIWTSKEAYVKMLGLGLSKGFQTFDVLSDELKHLFCYQQVSEYMLTVCSEINDGKLSITQISAEELLK